MKREEKNMTKGVYGYPQPEDFLALKQYIFIEQDEKRCLLLNFENEMELPITETAFTVRQLDASGNEIGSVDIVYSNISIEAGASYSADKGIVVDENCVGCIVKVKYVICGKFKYVSKSGEIVGRYDRRGYQKKRKKAMSLGGVSVKRKRLSGGFFFRFVAFVSLLLVVFSLFFIKYQLDLMEEEAYAGDTQSDVQTDEALDSSN